MEPIISPWFFYLLGVIGGIKTLFGAVAIISGCMLAGFLIARAWYWLAPEEFDKSDIKGIRMILKICGWIFPIFLALSIFTPSKETLIWMVVAKNVTYQNVEKAVEAGADFKNELKKDMLEIIEAIKGEEKSE